MATATKIEWCDHTASPWYGCSKVSSGCRSCYAEGIAKRNPKTLGIWGDDGVRVKSKSFVKFIEKVNREGERDGCIYSVFPSMCDPFEDRPELKPWRHEMFEVIDRCPNVRLLLLTKRPENIRRMWPSPEYRWCQTCGVTARNQDEDDEYFWLRCNHDDCDCDDVAWFCGQCGAEESYGRKNIWLLTSVENQEQANIRIPKLMECRSLSPVLGLSIEPLLGPVDVHLVPDFVRSTNSGVYSRTSASWLGHHWTFDVDWVICGGESGPHARPMHPDWVRSLRNQCQAAGVPFLFKQWGEWIPSGDVQLMFLPDRDDDPRYHWMPDRVRMFRFGKKNAGRSLDGCEWNEFPKEVA